MNQSATCPECSLSLAVPPTAAGRKIRCPKCRAVFTAPGEVLSLDDEPPPKAAPAANPQPANPFAFDAGPGRDDDDDDDDRPARRRRRPTPPQNNSAAKVVGGVVAAVVGLGVMFGIKYALSGGPSAIPDSKWQTVEVPGLFRAKLPGSPSTETTNMAGLRTVIKTYSPDKDSMYAVAYSEDTLPEHRQMLPTDALLNDACSGSVQALARDGGREVSRESVTLGPFPGKQLVVDIPKARGKLISRVYLVNGRLVILMTGGRGMEPDNANAQKLFGSLEILAAPAGGKPK